MERLKIALLYGADAVYIGGSMFGLRANATNFSMEEIREATTFAHKLGKKVYVTVNIILHNLEVEQLFSYLKDLENAKVDAIIVSDPAVIDVAIKKTNLEVHLSTQQSTLNHEAAAFWKERGLTRLVMARETTKADLIEIKNKVDIELETFIHGAMCAAMSGRCVLSNFLTDRDANRGGCSQICRWEFDLKDSDNKRIEAEKDFTFCTKDLIMLKHIPELIDIGVSSFKIEGRMRSIYYIATVVSIYRKVIDEYCNNPKNYKYNKEYEKILSRCANRESIDQFFDTSCNKEYQYYIGREEKSNQDFLGVIKDYDKFTKLATIEQRNYFSKGDIVEIFGPNIETITLTLNEIYDEDNNLIEVVRHPLQKVMFKIDKPVSKNCLIRKK
ncbi:MAG: U32 family peptidase [Bacilli bacterium]|nr:U32 family peptidase [Bacilli bacterium]